MITVLYLYFSAGTSWYCHVLPVDASSISQLNKCPKSFTAISVVFLTSFNSDLFWGITQVYREFLKWVIPSRHHRFQYKVMVIHGGWCGATPMKHLGNRARYFLSHGVGTPSYRAIYMPVGTCVLSTNLSASSTNPFTPLRIFFIFWLFNIAMENDLLIDDVPIKSDDFQRMC